ncbi:MAG: xanthine dehydrogenase family protein molybdopterin-binding subunit [Polyangiaceae bacterium]|nr:xanthine dehydrogenase family protein molybdopterin-binding subunit [Polyangiaceae bacterium]
MSRRVGRRVFLQAGLSAASGLVVGCQVEAPRPPPAPGPAPAAPPVDAAPPPPAKPFAPNAWVRVAPSGAVTIVVDKSEMGQGVETGLTMLVAEELECDWGRVSMEFAPVDPAYVNRIFGMQATGGSTSVRGGFEPLQKAGAAARMMLVASAAKQWGVDPSACRAEKGEVIHPPTGRRAGYGALVADAAAMPVPQDPPLKPAGERRLIGTRPGRLDAVAKATGRAGFGIDVRRPGMITAAIVRCPVFGGKVASFDDSKAREVKGVQRVLQVSSGVAVLADHTWAAMKGAEALSVKWDEGANAKASSEEITRASAALAKKPGKVAGKRGDAEKALAAASKRIEAVYEAPYQAHATMEPQGCVVDLGKEGCDIWVPTQSPAFVVAVAAKISGLPPQSIRVHTTYLGGGFGRRAEVDFVAEAVELAKATGAPVKVVWSREDDMRHDVYRPASYNVLRAGVGKDGAPSGWTHRIVGGSIMTRMFPSNVKGGIDPSSVEGAADLEYSIPDLLVDYHMYDAGIPVGFWRSVGHSQNAFVVECFLDELCAAAKKDPCEYRVSLLSGAPRLKAVVELAAKKAGWGTPLAPGEGGARRGRGIGATHSFGSFVAQVAEVTVGKDGAVKVDRVVAAVDCGQVVHPGIVEAQIESAIAFGLTAALRSEITIQNGRVKQANFHNFKLLRFDEMPKVEVHIVPSTEAPGGIGEPGTPPIAPAVVNAIFAATGKRIRKLPVRAADLKQG